MYCPHCGQERTSSETSFCSRCGFLLTGVAELLANGGIIPGTQRGGVGPSPRSKGIKLGLFIFLLTFIVVPLVAIISKGLGLQPWGVAIFAVLFSVGGILRMLYALLFESSYAPGNEAAIQNPALLNRPVVPGALPPQQSIPVNVYAPPTGIWRDTKDLQPGSVTEGTTKLLEKEDQ
jgi:hypothetical protein